MELKIIRNLRIQQGLTQMELASLSGVSLPTIQNIEMKKGNPSWETLEALANILGLQLSIQPKPADWDLLAQLGLPLTSQRLSSRFVPSSNLLVRGIFQAVEELLSEKQIDDRERKLEAVQACLLAIHHHFNTFFRRHFARSTKVAEVLPTQITGRLIKLRRLSVQRLSEYL